MSWTDRQTSSGKQHYYPEPKCLSRMRLSTFPTKSFYVFIDAIDDWICGSVADAACHLYISSPSEYTSTFLSLSVADTAVRPPGSWQTMPVLNACFSSAVCRAVNRNQLIPCLILDLGKRCPCLLHPGPADTASKPC